MGPQTLKAKSAPTMLLTLVKMATFGVVLLACACSVLAPPHPVALMRASQRRGTAREE